MSYLLKLDSSLISGANPDDFSIQYAKHIQTPGHWEVGLIKAFLWYSWHNVSSDNGNNIIRYSKDGGSTWEANIVIPNGIYSVTDINDYMQLEMKTRGDWDAGGETYYASLLPNFNTLKVIASLSNNYAFDFTAGSINELLGFNSQVVTATKSAENPADITRGVNALEINSDLTDAGWSNEFSGNTLFTFIPSSAPGSNLEITPNPAIYLSLNKQSIQRIRMWVTDQQNRRVNFNGENATYLLHIRKVKD